MSIESKDNNKLKKIFKIFIPYLFILSSLFIFIFFRWYVINLRWVGRFLPPEPDDSFGYISGIRLIGDTGFYLLNLKYILPWNKNDHLIHLPWKTALAIVKLFGDSSYVDVYKTNFYFGIVLLSLTILYILKVLEKDKLFWVISIFFLTLYNGSGEYHGFFWVVPSFYSLIASLLLISLIFEIQRNFGISEKKWAVLLFLITFLTVWSHPLGKYAFMAIVFSFIIYILLNYALFLAESTKILLKRFRLLISCGAIAIFSSAVIPYLMGVIPSTAYSLTETMQQIITKPSSYEFFRKLYLDKFSFNSPYTILLILGLFAILFNKKMSLLSIYLGFFTFSLTTSFFGKYAYRMIMYLWPLTFLIFSYGCYFLVQRLIKAYKTSSGTKIKIKFNVVGWSKELRITKDVLLLAFIIILISINCIYPFAQENYDWNINYANYARKRMDWKIDEAIVNYLDNVTNPGDLLIFEDKNAFMTITSLGLLDREVAYANWDWSEHYAFLQEKVNGTYLIATDGLERSHILNLTEAFEGRLAIYPTMSFGILRVYRLIVRQTESSYVFVQEDFDLQFIAEDNQTSFWSKTKNLNLIDDDDTKISGDNSLKIALSQTEKSQKDYFWYTYETVQDWSEKDKLVFDWYGTGDSKRIEILIYAPDGQNRFEFIFKNNFIGWRRMIFPLNNFIVLHGTPSWSNVKTIYFRFTLDCPYDEIFYLDRLVLDVVPNRGGKYGEMITNDVQTSIQILLSFFVLLFPAGLMWAFYVFRVRDLISLMALSFGLSFSLIFLTMLILNLALGVPITKTSAILTVTLLITLPPALHYINKFIKSSPRLSKSKYALNNFA